MCMWWELPSCQMAQTLTEPVCLCRRTGWFAVPRHLSCRLGVQRARTEGASNGLPAWLLLLGGH